MLYTVRHSFIFWHPKLSNVCCSEHLSSYYIIIKRTACWGHAQEVRNYTSSTNFQFTWAIFQSLGLPSGLGLHVALKILSILNDWSNVAFLGTLLLSLKFNQPNGGQLLWEITDSMTRWQKWSNQADTCVSWKLLFWPDTAGFASLFPVVSCWSCCKWKLCCWVSWNPSLCCW